MINLKNDREQQAPERLIENEHSKTEFLVFPLKVIISPLNAFKAISQNPDLKGIMLIAGLYVLATIVETCSSSSKVFLSISGISTSFLVSNMFPSFFVSVVTQNLLLFPYNWLIYASVLFLVMRAFGQKKGGWRPFFILVGYAFSVVIVQWTVSALLFTALPEIHYSNLSNWPPLSEDETLIAEAGIQEFWVPTLTYQILVYLINPLLNIVDIWLLVLSVIIVSIFNDVSWGKAATISISAFILRLFLKVFLFL